MQERDDEDVARLGSMFEAAYWSKRPKKSTPAPPLRNVESDASRGKPEDLTANKSSEFLSTTGAGSGSNGQLLVDDKSSSPKTMAETPYRNTSVAAETSVMMHPSSSEAPTSQGNAHHATTQRSDPLTQVTGEPDDGNAQPPIEQLHLPDGSVVRFQSIEIPELNHGRHKRKEKFVQFLVGNGTNERKSYRLTLSASLTKNPEGLRIFVNISSTVAFGKGIEDLGNGKHTTYATWNQRPSNFMCLRQRLENSNALWNSEPKMGNNGIGKDTSSWKPPAEDKAALVEIFANLFEEWYEQQCSNASAR